MSARNVHHVQSRYRKVYDFIASRFTERHVIMLVLAVAVTFLLMLIVGPFLPRYRGDIHGSVLRPSFEFGPVDHDVFADVKGEHPHAYALEYLKRRGIVRGFEDNAFRPDETMNRAFFFKMLTGARRAFPSRVRYGHCFSDVTNEWFAPSVCYAKSKGWIEGGDDAAFEPEHEMTRGEALEVMMKAYGVGAGDSFVEAAEQKGWLDGLFDSDRFETDKTMTRAEIAELLFRIDRTESPFF